MWSGLKDLAYKMLKSTGHEEISLSSLSSSDYTELEELVNFLIDEFDGKGVNISLPSLRIDAFSLDVMSKVQDVKKSSLTFAPEAGSQRLRDVINKGLTEEEILTRRRRSICRRLEPGKALFHAGPAHGDRGGHGGHCAAVAKRLPSEYYEIPKGAAERKVFR